MRTVLAVWIGGTALGVGTLLIVRQAPYASLAGSSLLGEAALFSTGWLLISVGILVWRQPPTGRWAFSLVAAGAAWYASEWNNPGVGSSVVFTVGLVVYAACPAVVAHAALSYPTGRFTSRAERYTVLAAYLGTVVVLGLAPALVFDPADQGCRQCATNLVSVGSNRELVHAFDRAGTRLGVVWALVLAVLAAWRLGQLTPAARRLRAPVLLGASAYMALVAATYAHELGAVVFNDSFDRHLWLGQAAALIVVALGVAAAAWRAQRARLAVARMVVELAEAAAPGGLRESLAARLGDPDLEIVYPVGDGGHIDHRGMPGQPTHIGESGRATTALVRDGETVAVLVHRADLLGDDRLVEDLVSAAAVTLQNERLAAQARAQLVELRTSQARLVAASDRERQQLERDLHDGAQQRLVGLGLALHLARARMDPVADRAALACVETAETELALAVAELRQLASGIHPAVLTDLGLAAALSALAERAMTPLRIVTAVSERLPAATERTAYQLLAEVARMGSLTASLVHRPEGLVVEVDATRQPEQLADVADRVGALDGTMETTSVPGGGVRIRAVIPCV